MCFKDSCKNSKSKSCDESHVRLFGG